MSRKAAKITLAAALGLAMTGAAPEGPGPIRALVDSFRRDDAVVRASASGPVSTTLKWWAVPRRARSAAGKLAAGQGASVARYLRVEEPDGSAYFQVIGVHKSGKGKGEPFVLATIPDPSAPRK